MFQRRMDELKAIARELGLEPVGDRRKCQTWELAIEAAGGYPILRAIKLATENTPDVDRVQEPIAQMAETSPGVTFSAAFLARYSPPQSENIFYEPDADGQLSLLDFEVVVINEPPDPDDFDSMFVFWAAYDAWAESNEDNEVSLEDNPEIFLDSFCEWAPCPYDWYEPAGENFPGVDRVQEPIEDFTGSEPEPESIKLCPCSAMPASQCDGTTAYHIFNDRIVSVPCYKHQHYKLMPARSPPGGDVTI